jgi:hypothetical protein
MWLKASVSIFCKGLVLTAERCKGKPDAHEPCRSRAGVADVADMAVIRLNQV